MRKKLSYWIILILAVFVFLTGVISIFAIPTELCLREYEQDSCNDIFEGSCTLSGACWHNGPVSGSACFLSCWSYVVIDGNCTLFKANIDCGVMIN